ncbi:MAG TPA: nucleotidyl transferase AbiEii/AbiGii toxin family protein [Xanthobacteraceae bacterium]|nr:nucleotidyl transferase AbiEii/AbiGii toxin family protein [Xanthobacteraceae bacterium]
MNSKAASIKSAIADFMVRHAIPGEMEQNLIKETIHLHLLSALSDTGVLRHVVFQGGTALRLCYGGERYSEDLDFVCGKAGSYVDKIDFDRLVVDALETTKKSLHRDFDVDPDQIALKQPSHPMAIKSDSVSVTAWQIVVPIGTTPHSPKSRIKIEFANVPSYDNGPNVANVTQGLVRIQDVILTAESVNEILADKAVALTAREVLKYRDVWDVWYLVNRLNAQADRDIVTRKFTDYGTSDVEAKAEQRRQDLAKRSTAKLFLDEMRRFLPAKRVAEISDTGLQQTILAASGELIKRAVLPMAPS